MPVDWIRRVLGRQRDRGLVKVDPLCGDSRVECRIDGEVLWFEAEGAELAEADDALACLYFCAQVHGDFKRRLRSGISPVLVGNIARIHTAWSDWWPGCHGCQRFAPRPPDTEAGDLGAKSGLFFSLGVDSFYSLARNPGVDALISVWGYDVPLEDVSRFESMRESLRAVAGTRGRQLVVVTTNLRRHHVFGHLDWNRYFGGALAAVGHLLGESFGRFIISSSFCARFPHVPLGSHWLTDPCWSSDRVVFEHYGEDTARYEKVRLIADDELVTRHLRVCWEHPDTSQNCGRCEKCVRTRLALSLCGVADVPSFTAWQDPLADAIRGCRAIPEPCIDEYREMMAADGARAFRDDLSSLLDRSTRPDRVRTS